MGAFYTVAVDRGATFSFMVPMVNSSGDLVSTPTNLVVATEYVDFAANGTWPHKVTLEADASAKLVLLGKGRWRFTGTVTDSDPDRVWLNITGSNIESVSIEIGCGNPETFTQLMQDIARAPAGAHVHSKPGATYTQGSGDMIEINRPLHWHGNNCKLVHNRNERESTNTIQTLVYIGSLRTLEKSWLPPKQLFITDGVTSGIGVTTLTSATGGFIAGMVNQKIRLHTGTNLTRGVYEITAHTDTNTVTLDAAPDDGVGGLTGASGYTLSTQKWDIALPQSIVPVAGFTKANDGDDVIIDIGRSPEDDNENHWSGIIRLLSVNQKQLWYGGVAMVSEVPTFNTSGTFKLSNGTWTTAAINYNATSANVQSALIAAGGTNYTVDPFRGNLDTAQYRLLIDTGSQTKISDLTIVDNLLVGAPSAETVANWYDPLTIDQPIPHDITEDGIRASLLSSIDSLAENIIIDNIKTEDVYSGEPLWKVFDIRRARNVVINNLVSDNSVTSVVSCARCHNVMVNNIDASGIQTATQNGTDLATQSGQLIDSWDVRNLSIENARLASDSVGVTGQGIHCEQVNRVHSYRNIGYHSTRAATSKRMVFQIGAAIGAQCQAITFDNFIVNAVSGQTIDIGDKAAERDSFVTYTHGVLNTDDAIIRNQTYERLWFYDSTKDGVLTGTGDESLPYNVHYMHDSMLEYEINRKVMLDANLDDEWLLIGSCIAIKTMSIYCSNWAGVGGQLLLRTVGGAFRNLLGTPISVPSSGASWAVLGGYDMDIYTKESSTKPMSHTDTANDRMKKLRYDTNGTMTTSDFFIIRATLIGYREEMAYEVDGNEV